MDVGVITLNKANEKGHGIRNPYLRDLEIFLMKVCADQLDKKVVT